MRILRASSYRTMPWKNGGGTTTEIAVHPAGASIDNFEWRVSMARVETDGPFSSFPGVDRTLAVLDGQGIVLEMTGEKAVTLTALWEPLSFPADVQTAASLVAGPITDLNVMTRRGWWSHAVERIDVKTPLHVALIGTVTLVLVATGAADVRVGGEKATLSVRDCLWIDGAGKELDVAPLDAAELFVIRLIRQG